MAVARGRDDDGVVNTHTEHTGHADTGQADGHTGPKSGMSTATKIGSAVGAVILVAVIVALAFGQGGVRTYPEGSPEAAVQTFLQHLYDGELQDARSGLEPGVANRCSTGDLRYTPASYRDVARITEVTVNGSTAEVTVVFSDQSGLFDEPYESAYDFDMTLIADDWLISGLDERFGC